MGKILKIAFGAVKGFLTGGPVGAFIGAGLALVSETLFAPDSPDRQSFSASDSQLELDRGTLLNVTSTVEPIKVVYGSRKVGGFRVLAETTGSDNKYLHVVMGWCEGEINSVDQIYIDDKPLSQFAGLVETYHHEGTDDQVADATLVSRVSAWTTDHRLRGVAYTYLRLEWDQDKFFGFPAITAEVFGKLVYDTRDATTKYSNNPALCIYDYLTNTRYGRGISPNNIDTASFNTVANYCDELVNIPNGSGGTTTQKRYTCNGVLNTSRSTLSNLNELLSSCNAFLIYSGGKYKLRVRKAEISVKSFDESHVVGAWTISPGSKQRRFNRAMGDFFNPERSWQPDVAIVDSPTFLAEDNGTLLEAKIPLPYTSNIYMAQQLVQQHLKQSRLPMMVQLTMTHEVLNVEVGDVIDISHDSPQWENKEFRVLSMNIKEGLEVAVTLQEYSAAVYNLDSLTDVSSTPTPNLPDPGSVGDPSGLTITSGTSELLALGDGTIISRMLVSWTAADDAFLEAYEVEHKLSTGGDWQRTEGSPNSTSFHIGPVQDGLTYLVRVRSRNSNGVHGAWLPDDVGQLHTVTGKTAAPGDSSGLATTTIVEGIKLDWTNPSDADFNYTEIWWADVNDRNDVSFAKAVEVPGTSWAFQGMDDGDEKYFWVRSVDTSGNVGGFHPSGATAGVLGTAGGVDAAVGENSVDTPQLVNLSVTNAKMGYLSVTTLKVGDDQITIPRAYYNDLGISGSSYGGYSDASWHNFHPASCAITLPAVSEGSHGKVLVTFSMALLSATTNWYIELGLFRDATYLTTLATINGSNDFRGTMQYVDDPGDGSSHTYSVQLRLGNASASWTATNYYSHGINVLSARK